MKVYVAIGSLVFSFLFVALVVIDLLSGPGFALDVLLPCLLAGISVFVVTESKMNSDELARHKNFWLNVFEDGPGLFRAVMVVLGAMLFVAMILFEVFGS
jgi:hypothetical protein